MLKFCSPSCPAWCLRNEGVSSVLLGASNADQLMENIGAIQVSAPSRSNVCPQHSLPCCTVREKGVVNPASRQVLLVMKARSKDEALLG